MTIEQSVMETLKTLSPIKKAEVLDFARFLQQKPTPNPPRRILKGALAHLDIHFTAEDLQEARREMWRGYMGEDG